MVVMSKAYNLLFFVLLIFCTNVQAEKFHAKDYFKKIIKEFDIENGQAVSVTNKFGQVRVNAWDSDKVQFSVEIVVDAKNEEAANKVYDRINIRFTENGETLSAVSEIESNDSWNWFGSSGSCDYSINYTIMMPASNPIMVSNKYGDCKIKDITSKGIFRIKFGDLSIYNRMEEIDLDIAYGTAKIEDAYEAKCQVKLAKVYAGNFEKLTFNSKYSHIQTKDVGELVIESKYDDYVLGRVSSMTNAGKYDDFHIQEVSELKVTTTFSDFEVGRLHHFADLNMRYGEFILDELDSRFRDINIQGQYTDFDLGTDGLESFDVDLQGEYVDWEWPKELRELKSEKLGNRHAFSGYLQEQNTGRVIQANLSFGSLVLK